MRVTLDGGGASLEGRRLRLRLADPAGRALAEVSLPAALDLRHTFSVSRPALWWPAGHGAQPRYHLTATLVAGDDPRDERSLRLGLRRLRLVQEPLAGEVNTSFLFEVNGRPLFAGGANWTPPTPSPRASAAIRTAACCGPPPRPT